MVGGIVGLRYEDFLHEWRSTYDSLFTDRPIESDPFADPAWRKVVLGSPAYFIGKEIFELHEESDLRHLRIYHGLEKAIHWCGDKDMVGFLQGGPYENPSIFYTEPASAHGMRKFREAALDGFDLHIFSRSRKWGVAISWEEEVALVGGEAEFMDYFLALAGNDDVLLESR